MIRVPSQGRRAPKARALTRVPNRRDIFLVIQVEKIGPKRQSDNHCAASLPVNLRDKGEAWGHRSAALKHEPTNQSAKHHPEIENVAQSSLAVQSGGGFFFSPAEAASGGSPGPAEPTL